MTSGSPAEAASGQLHMAFFVYLSVASAKSSLRDWPQIRDLLQTAIESSEVGRARGEGLRTTGVTGDLPPEGAERFVIGVSAMADLGLWRAQSGGVYSGRTVADTVAGLLAAVPLQSVPGAAVDSVEVKMIISA
jgi:hypothetical protein